VAAGAQDGVRLGQGVGGNTQIALGVVQDEVLGGDELAGEPEAGAGVGEIQSRQDAVADRAGAQAFVEAGDGVGGVTQVDGEGVPRNGLCDAIWGGFSRHCGWLLAALIRKLLTL
jgi:hypothetical protein